MAPKRVLAVLGLGLVVMLWTGAATAGEVSIGYNTLVGGTKAGTCHATYFRSPSDAVKEYQKTQKERFEPVDPAVIERLSKGVQVKAIVVTYKQPNCAQNSGVPEKVVLTEKGGDTPILVIPLAPEEVKLKNLQGAEFTAVNAWGTVDPTEITKLRERDLDFHLVYSDHGFKDKWKKDYAAKILK